jgi:hypothetical protein
MEDYEDEVYSAQILRQLHSDAVALLEHYHDMLQLLENQRVKAVLSKVLEGICANLTMFEEVFESEFAAYPPIENRWDDEPDDSYAVSENENQTDADGMRTLANITGVQRKNMVTLNRQIKGLFNLITGAR